MKPVLNFLFSRWTISFAATLIVALLVWFFGPFIAALAGVLLRALIILLLVLVWGGINALISWRRRKRDAALASGVAASNAAADSAADEERAKLAEKLGSALALLRKASGKRGYLYEQPWYVIIGPPGAGKTTALLNAGLKFPLAAEMGQGAVAGVGGTRLCDWWFTEEAVLIDTAGRYTTQDSNAATDSAGWTGFLDLLKRTRARQALNGVLVAISVADIAAAPREERLAHARAIRNRIKEITARLGLRLPVYALLTKADLVAGFTEFFDDLDAEKRAQVWGTTFGIDEGGNAGPAGNFATAFKALVERLDERLPDLLQRERSPDRRALIAGFPTQVSSLEAPIGEFLTEAFGGSTLDPAPFLRGVYLTSGTQEGTPIDRLTAALSRSFGIDQRRAPSLRPQAGRSYFLGRLLREVVFGEAMLAGSNPAVRRRTLALRIAGFAAVGIIFIAVLAGLMVSHANNAQAIAATRAGIAQYTTTAQGAPLDPVSSADLASVAPLLDAARAIPFGPGDTTNHGAMGLGLDQRADLATASRNTYIDALQRIMLPRLILQLEAEMRGGFDRPEFLYQATRVYLMLGGQGPLDRSLVEAWMALDWQRLYPGPANQPLRDDLMQHLDALLNTPLPPVDLDGALVESARATFSRVSLASRVYSLIQGSRQAAALPAFVPAQAMGPAGQGLFTLASGKPLTTGIAGFYTPRGFYTVLLPALSHAARDVASESWVLGQSQQIDPSSPDMVNLEQNVIALYEKDYEATWNNFLGDINLAPMSGAAQASQALYILGSPQSPLTKLLVAITHNLALTASPEAAKAAKAASHLSLPGASAIAQQASQLQGVIGSAPGATAPAPGSEVDAYYQPLIAYVGDGTTAAPLGLTLQLLNQVQQQLATIAASAPGAATSAPAAGGDPASLLSSEAAHDPLPVSRWLKGIVITTDTLRGGSAAQAAAAAFNGAGGPASLCSAAVNGRYPFTPASSTDIPLGDFAHLFAPGGLLDSFFTTQVRPYVNMTGAHWSVQAVNGVTPPISQGALAEFQRADQIRQLFFAAGATPSVQFTITPVSLDTGAAQAMLELGGLNVGYAHGPPIPTQVSWPGTDGMQVARLVITGTGGGPPATIEANGPWALFRLFNQGSLTESGGADRYTLTFSVGGHQAVYSITAGSVLNPFMPGVLQDFRCPSLQG